MPSADFCHLIAPPLDGASTRPDDRPPRVLRADFHAYARRIYVVTFRTGMGLWIFLPPHPVATPRMRFLFVGPALCLQLPSDSISRWTPLLFG